MPDKPLRVLHFADAHIDIANYGRRDPVTTLPIRVMDFLSALDQIVDAAIEEEVDLVIFAGDAYKDRNPQPTFQREWGQRMMRLSQAGIPTVLLIGNHDVSPASGRANTLQEFATLSVPHIHVADRIETLGPEKLGLDVQVVTVPWISRSQLMTREESSGMTLDEVLLSMEERVNKAILYEIGRADPSLPLIMTAHASVQGATYGSERMVMLGHELVLGGGIVSDKRLDYVALGHIHKHQALGPQGQHPPIVYPGSIERIDFGEVGEEKGYILAEVAKGRTEWSFRPLRTRRYIDLDVDTPQADSFMDDIMRVLPKPETLRGAICRLKLSYPADWESLLDEKVINDHFEQALSIQIQRHRQSERRARLGDTAAVENMTPLELLETFWHTKAFAKDEIEALRQLALEVLAEQVEE